MNLLAGLLNGLPLDVAQGVSPGDRGLQYGDGLFETMLLKHGTVQALDDHLVRLAKGCERLQIPIPSRAQLQQDLTVLCKSTPTGIVKIVITRGVGGRGYRADPALVPTRLLTLHAHEPVSGPDAIAVRWCTTRLARHSVLAGLKHLNRLEQVLAQNEWSDNALSEGLMLDMEGEVIGGTSSNVFAVVEGTLCTPDIRYCGVRGVMRERVLRHAQKIGMALEERALWPHDIEVATEVFVTNAVRGIRPVTRLDEQEWTIGPVTRSLAQALELW